MTKDEAKEKIHDLLLRYDAELAEGNVDPSFDDLVLACQEAIDEISDERSEGYQEGFERGKEVAFKYLEKGLK